MANSRQGDQQGSGPYGNPPTAKRGSKRSALSIGSLISADGDGECVPIEICKCAAIKLADGTLVKGLRHGNCFTVAFFLGYDHIGAIQGFLTSDGRFVTREEGRALQDAAGIKSADPGGYRGSTLFSEDLY